MASSNKFVGGLPTTQIWDPSEIEKMDVNTPEFKRFLLSMHQNMNSMAMAVNDKASGTKSSQDMVVGQVDLGGVNASTTFPSGKTVFDLYRKVVNFGPIECVRGAPGDPPTVVTRSVPHGIESNNIGKLVVMSLSGVANSIYTGYATPIPFVEANLSYNRWAALWIDKNFVTIRLQSDGPSFWDPAFNHVFVTVEYIYVPY